MKELDKSERRNEFSLVNGSESFNYYRVLLSSSTKLLILKIMSYRRDNFSPAGADFVDLNSKLFQFLYYSFGESLEVLCQLDYNSFLKMKMTTRKTFSLFTSRKLSLRC